MRILDPGQWLAYLMLAALVGVLLLILGGCTRSKHRSDDMCYVTFPYRTSHHPDTQPYRQLEARHVDEAGPGCAKE